MRDVATQATDARRVLNGSSPIVGLLHSSFELPFIIENVVYILRLTQSQPKDFISGNCQFVQMQDELS